MAIPVDGAEAFGLLLHVLDQVRAVDAFGKAGEVLDFGGKRKLSAYLQALDHQRFQASAGGIDSGGVSGATGTNNDDFMHVGLISETIRCP